MTDRSETQKEASRKNGAKSKGTITEEGKVQSSMDGLKHGGRASDKRIQNLNNHMLAKTSNELRSGIVGAGGIG